MSDDDDMNVRIAKAERQAQLMGYTMRPQPGEPIRWRLLKDLGLVDIHQLEDELFGVELLKSEPRGGGIDGSLVKTFTVK